MKNDNNQTTELFSMALNINKPWIIEKIEFNKESELHIYIVYIKLTKFECRECGKNVIYMILKKRYGDT